MGKNKNTDEPPPYGEPPVGGGYPPPVGGGYPPPVGGGYPPPVGGGYPPTQPYAPPPGGQNAGPPYITQQAPPTVIMTREAVAPAQTVVVVRGGGCSRCGVGVMVESFSCCGILIGILFFPLGLICCLLMRSYHCNRCGYSA